MVRKVVGSLFIASCVISFSGICKADVYGTFDADNKLIGYMCTVPPSIASVNLTKKTAHKYDIKTYDCDEVTRCVRSQCNESKAMFREADVKVGKTIFANIVGTAFLPAMLICGPYLPKESHFNQNGFDLAVETAYSNSNIGSILLEYGDYVKYASKLKADYALIANDKLTKLYDEINDKQYNNLKNIKQKVSVNDMTGFWTYNDSLPSINIHTQNFDKLIQEPFNVEVDLGASPDEFREKIIKLRTEIDANYKNAIARLEDKINQYKIDVADKLNNFNIPHSEELNVRNFNIKCNCPSTVNSDVDKHVNINYTILSRDWEDIYPAFSNNDSQLAVSFDGSNIKITNKTDKYLQLKSISVYYNSEVSNIDDDKLFELPPETTKTVDAKYIVNPKIRNEAKYSSVTRQNAMSTNFSFGFAVKYSTSQQNVVTTLYKTNKYNLAKVLERYKM